MSHVSPKEGPFLANRVLLTNNPSNLNPTKNGKIVVATLDRSWAWHGTKILSDPTTPSLKLGETSLSRPSSSTSNVLLNIERSPKMQYQVSIRAEKLPRVGWGKVPDPYVVVKAAGGEVLGRSEPVLKTTQPAFSTTFFLKTSSSTRMPLTVEIFHQKDDRKLAAATFEASEVHQSQGSMTVVKTDTGARVCASVRTSVRGSSVGTASLHIRGLDMKNVEPGLLGLGRSDPYFEVSKKDADHSSGIVQWTVVYRSKHINNHLNPYWEPFQLSLEELCYCDLDWPIKLSVWDFQENGSHRIIGEVETTLQLLTETVAFKGNADREKALEVIGESKSKSKNLRTRGLLVVLKADVDLEDSVSSSNSF